MKTYVSTPTSKLNIGMVIHFYGEEFRITGNPVPCKNPLLQGAYTVACEIIQPMPKGDYMELLNDYKSLQSNDLATYAVVVKR
jgi:hypothetical protein